MERKGGGCCLAPRSAGAAWQMGSIMLKFRPIAPKPAAMAPGPTPAPAVVPAAGRGKRKAVGGGGGRRGRKPKKAVTVAAAPPAVGNCKDSSENGKPLPSRSPSSSGTTSVDTSPPPPPSQQLATLALLPAPPTEDEAAVDAVREEPASLVAAGAQPMMPPAAAAEASCWVTVEEVTGTWRDGEAPPSAACVRSGADDNASAFVSDQLGRVAWRSAAFGRLVSADDGDDEEAPVALAGALPAWGTCAGFTCRVRIRHSVGSSVVAPCDVCRLDAAGCYLWRLDLLAALTLGRLPASRDIMTP